jgi:hypothetical protein
MLNPHLQAAPWSPTGEMRLTPAGMSGNGSTGAMRPAIGAGSGRETAFWCCSEIVARAILPPKARQQAVYLGNTGLDGFDATALPVSARSAAAFRRCCPKPDFFANSDRLAA